MSLNIFLYTLNLHLDPGTKEHNSSAEESQKCWFPTEADQVDDEFLYNLTLARKAIASTGSCVSHCRMPQLAGQSTGHILAKQMLKHDQVSPFELNVSYSYSLEHSAALHHHGFTGIHILCSDLDLIGI